LACGNGGQCGHDGRLKVQTGAVIG
jgi:hypothetical protein